MFEMTLAGTRRLQAGLSQAMVVYIGLTAALVFATLLGLGAGRFPVAPGTVASILVAQVFDVPTYWTEVEERIVTLVRGPRVALVSICGAGLAIAGAAMQGIFRNPLASPQILGVSSGAAFGGALAILLGLSGLAMVGSAFVMGVVALLTVALIVDFR